MVRLGTTNNLVDWFTRSRIYTNTRLPSQVLDLCMIAPLQCVEEDDLQGIAPNLDIQNFNPDPPIYALKFCPVPGFTSILGIANEDGNIAFQDTDKETPRMPLAGLSAHNNAIFDFSWCPTDHNRLVTVSGDQKVALWDTANGELKRLRELRSHSRSVKCVEWRPASTTEFATGARDNLILIWDTRSNSDTRPDNIVRNAHTHPERQGADGASVTGLVWLDDNNIVSVGGNDGVIKVWDMRKNYSLYKKDPIPKQQIFHPGTSGNQGYTGVLHSPSSCYIYVPCRDHVIYKYDIINAVQRPISTYTGADIDSFFIKSSLSVDGNYLASGSSDNNVYIWNTSSPGGHVANLGPQEENVTCVAWNFKENILASCTDDMRHRIWRPGQADKERVRGIATMTGKRPEPVKLSPLPSQLSTPSSLLSRAQHRTPSSARRSDRKRNTPLRTPSIKSFMTPKTPGGTPGASTSSLATTPVSLNRQGVKRRRVLEEDKNDDSRKDARIEAVGLSITKILQNSPVKHQFSPTKRHCSTLSSPSKRLISPRLFSPLRRPTPLESPLRAAAVVRRPLEIVPSPTANLPNFVRDGISPRLNINQERPPRKPDWLTQHSLEKKKSQATKSPRTKTPKSKKKIILNKT